MPGRGHATGLTLKSSASCWRVASRRSKRCPARAKAAQASSSAGSSPRCTVLRARGRAGDTAPRHGGPACPPSSLPVPHVDIAEEAVLGGPGAAERGPVKLLRHRPQDAGAGPPESLRGGDKQGRRGHRGHGGGHAGRGPSSVSHGTHRPSLRRGEVEELQVGVALQGSVEVLEGPVHPGHQRCLRQVPPAGTRDTVGTPWGQWGPCRDTGDSLGTVGTPGTL